MHTLRELGEFVGFGDATPPRPDGGATTAKQITMRSIANSLSVLSTGQRSSLRAMMDGLQRLPPITLQAESLGDSSGEVPPVFALKIRVHPSSGAVISTVLNVFEHGVLTFPEQQFLPNADEVLGAFVSRPGLFLGKVTRTGVSSTGVAVLEKTFQFAVREKPAPPPPEREPAPIVPPVIAVKSNGDGSFVVSGSLFLPSAPITIRVAAADLSNILFSDTSTADGKLVGFPTGKICTGHGVHELSFSAEDGRIDPSNHRAITSNFIKVSCPFLP